MRLQFEDLDLLDPWPTFTLREGYHAIRVLMRVGTIPIGEVISRPARSRKVTPKRLRRRVNEKVARQLLRIIARESLTAGPENFTSLSEFSAVRNWATALPTSICEMVERELLLPEGLPQPWNDLCRKAQQIQSFPMPPVTVAVCTRDRPHELEGCVKHLLELDYPNFQVLIVDNSKDPGPTFEIAQRLQVPYTREPKAGLSRARNAALRATQRGRWVAFTDDDCRPEPNWLRELVRELQDSNCRCVTGLVLPAQLENAAEIAFEIYGGLGRGYSPIVYSPDFLRRSRTVPAHTWRIGAGANMLLDADMVQWLGGYDEDMGPGGVGGCGEDTDIFYQILNTGNTIHYNPRAIVHHFHRSSPAALRKQISSYAIGHAAYHTRCFFAYGDYRSVIHICYHLPKWFYKNFWRAFRGNTKYPFSLIKLEVKGTVAGVVQYSSVKLKKMMQSAVSRLASIHLPRKKVEPKAEEKLMSYGDVTVKSLSELPEYRHVLGNLILRDLKVKYQSKALGFIWSLLHPAILIGIWYIVFSMRVFNFKLDHYWAFLICGIVPFRFIQESISEGAWSVRKNSAIIRKVYMPMEILVIATVTVKFVDFLLQLFVAILLLAALHHGPAEHFSLYKTFVVLPGAMLLTYIFILGICMPLAGWTVIYRDLDHIIGLFLTASFYITPIFWWKVPESLKGRLAFALNPFMDLVELFRGPMYWGHWPSNMAVGGGELMTWGIASLFAFGSLIIGYFLLGHVKNQLAEVV